MRVTYAKLLCVLDMSQFYTLRTHIYMVELICCVKVPSVQPAAMK